MHTNTFAILSSALFLAPSLCAARVLPPQPPRILPRGDAQSLLSSSATSLADKCSFTLFHKQLMTAARPASTSDGKINYVQVDSLEDHMNGITIDLASSRPRAERNSYVKVSATQIFEIDGLVDDTKLTIYGSDGEDALVFEYDGLKWATEGGSKKLHPEAWCNTGSWAESGNGSRVCYSSGFTYEDQITNNHVQQRSMECAFPCAKIEDDEENEREELR